MDPKYFASKEEKDAARNPATPPHILRELSEKYSSDIREIVARNPSTPKDVLANLSQDSTWAVKQSVATNPSISLETFRSMVNDLSDKSVGQLACRIAICGKYRIITKEVIEELSNHPDAIIRGIVANQNDTDPSILVKLSEDEDWFVKMAVASNASSPPAAIKELAGDDDESIAEVALNHPCLKYLVVFR
jgi:hypothetical protein